MNESKLYKESVATIVTTPIFYYLSNFFIPFSLSFANELSS
ncbi:hypothetical protein SAMN02910384_02732 [Pseudobutyrivibrio sp. ACV-2]|nr:hypothetical protein SAMN02910384_02732 [Pseudobutyrivibrio sp. ACV-2]